MAPISRQRAAALVEFQIVLLLGLLPLVLGILQLALLLMAKHLVNYATFQAARSGAVAAANPDVMRRALAVGLMPLHVVSSKPVSADNITSVALAADLRSSVATTLYARLTILKPGAPSQQTLQQANVLQIRVSYCQELVVPLINQMLPRLLQWLDDDAWHQACYLMGRVPLVAEAAINLQSDARFHADD